MKGDIIMEDKLDLLYILGSDKCTYIIKTEGNEVNMLYNNTSINHDFVGMIEYNFNYNPNHMFYAKDVYSLTDKELLMIDMIEPPEVGKILRQYRSDCYE